MGVICRLYVNFFYYFLKK